MKPQPTAADESAVFSSEVAGQSDAPGRPAPSPAAIHAVVTALQAEGVAVDDRSLTRSLYSSDASVYRVEPGAVVFPRSVEDIDAVIAACADNDVPITSRGAGTSIAGNAIGTGIVIDHSKYLDMVLKVDPESHSARVQSGVAHATLQRAAAPHGLRFGPDPSSHSRCTIGGMIGNNACGSRALGYGRTSDNVRGLHLVTATGEHLRVGSLAPTDPPASQLLDTLQSTVNSSLATIRTEFGRFSRQVSGYALDALLPESRFDVTRMLVGSEGTLGVVVEADVRLVADATHRVMGVLGFENMVAAAAAVPSILPFSPIACEGLDSRITDVVRSLRPAAVPEMPRGAGWLFVEFAGEDRAQLESMVEAVASVSGALGSRVVESAAEAAALWKIREDGSGLVARTPSGRPAHAGWEDAAVPPEHLGAYLARFEELLTEHGLVGVPYGHFGDGCVHVRIDFDLDDSSGRQRYEDFLDEAAKLVGEYGGSMSGEHGDGRARSSLLTHMYSPQAIELFRTVKHHFDPANLMNPGVIVDPAPASEDIRYLPAPTTRTALAFAYPHDADDLFGAVHRCTGVGRCVAPNSSATTVICPSFQATGNEKDSTRGRARVLQDAVSGRLGRAGLASSEVHQALDMCLSCKGCKSDCPTGVDMATYKAEVLHQKYRGRFRPRSHYSLGRLPQWLRFARKAPRMINWLTGIRLTHPLAAWIAGIDARRSIPAIGDSAERAAWRAAQEITVRSSAPKNVVLFVDTFTDSFTPAVATALVEVLHSAGYRVHLPEKSVCCGLTWISTGQLDSARRRLEQTVATLHPYVTAGMTVLGIEPSCTAALRSDLTELIESKEAAEVSDSVKTLSELLMSDDDYEVPDLNGVEILAQPHCHHHAVLGWETDRALLERSGATVTSLGGCCGLAGNFGAERGHYDVSVAVAQTQLLPALNATSPETIVLADGFSCRTQIDHLSDRQASHLAELLAGSLTSRK
ncbi:FAD-binding and (Fe-S)-binding domain-containing protein [Rhodococcus sp. IEGM 1307]|jgi:FAD/FMN-containing dehydrogenase/Fe-S oxidoreductase|uniref:FAD-binding and (Fe-S)-binding domain-containing protein n=1 Tax=Rhodococcus sp. IEGM 1307 TaxID=3047091 RepID=UPI0024B814EC|nr:FAD-binding and (Fe-S)-binding domain-containing protein [Rhodococcus sp. IEGM 1307]MDI9978691.1 FAD-binding and (Fe-S)-binding domain-containing protein [Rhodococcus sp. IEGM 1307]